jgi:hypothetical protein
MESGICKRENIPIFFYFGIENVFESIKGKEEKKQLKIFYVN